MSQVRRIYVEKKAPFAVRAKELKSELKDYLGLTGLSEVRVFVRYDVENISEETYRKALVTVFSEPPIDDVYEEKLPLAEGDRVFSVEYLPGQFDQRADSAEQCVKLLKETEEPIIRSATTYILKGSITDEEFEGVVSYCINPVDSRRTDETKPETLVTEFAVPEDVKI
ncbi:MAG: phosphoribosylformylglycinamidine synthase, partial [Lachnospiraceae bacterium]|nr:phosphoribosylformylglycinamidine synthase [Lachnospiraceae bacterium]